ncbi:hypothetical protein RFI_28958, partial [Reticulomyxa filosa]
SEEEEILIIIVHWVRKFDIKLGWIREFDKLVVNYVMLLLCIIFFYSCQPDVKFLFIFIIYNHYFNIGKYNLCLWNMEASKQTQFKGHSSDVYCVKFSPYHYRNHYRSVICSSSVDEKIIFWDIKDNRKTQVVGEHTDSIYCMEVSPLNMVDICALDHMTKLFVYGMLKHLNHCMFSMDIQMPFGVLIIGVIGGNGYTICSGSWDKTIRIWDIETTKQLNVFKKHEHYVKSVKYGPWINGCANTILSGSSDSSVRLWDNRSGKQIQLMVIGIQYALDRMTGQFDFGIFDQIRKNYIRSKEIMKTMEYYVLNF